MSVVSPHLEVVLAIDGGESEGGDTGSAKAAYADAQDLANPHLFSRAELVNTVSLYCTTAANYAVPLLLTPLLARRLGPSGFGQATTGLAVAVSVGMLIDYGFPFSGTRRVAQHQDSKEIVQIVSSIQTAKVLLSLITILAAAVAWPVVMKHLKPGESAVLGLGLLSGIGRGLLPLYYFQGINRLAYPAILTSVLRAFGMIAALPFVRSPLDAGFLLAADAATSTVTLLLLTSSLHRAVRWQRPSLFHAIRAIRDSWSLFLFSLLASTYTSFGILAARSFVPFSELGIYGGVDRISRAAASAFGPIGQVAYPKISRMIHSGSGKARHAARWTFYLNVFVGATLCALMLFAARPIVSMFLGPEYRGAVKVLGILSLQLLATSLSRSLGVQWIVPLGLDRLMTKLVAASVITYFALLCTLAPRFGASGMALAFVLAEVQLPVAMFISLNKMGLGWWQSRTPNS